MAHHFSFSESQFNRLFPFYILINRDLEMIAFGNSMYKLFDLNYEKQFNRFFSIPRPLTPIQNFDDLIALQNQIVVLESATPKKLLLRGQFELLNELSEILFVGSPWLDTMEQVRENNLVIDDFAKHDPSIDLHYELKSQEITAEDLKQLIGTINKQKEELKLASKEIHDISLFSMQNPDPLIRINFEGDILRNNPAAAPLDFFEFENKNYRNDEFFKLIAARIDLTQPRMYIEAAAGGSYYSFICVPMIEERYINIYGRDVTKKKVTENELTRLSLVASANDNGVLFTTPEGKITWANEGFCRMTGYSMEEVIGKTPIELSRGPLTDHDTLKRILESFYNGVAFNIEVIYYRKNGTWFWGRSTTQPIKNSKGGVEEYFGIIADITDEKELEQLFRKTLETIGDNVWEHDFRTGKTYFSNSNNELLGFTTNELTDNQELWWSRVYKEDYEILEANDKKYRDGTIDSHNLEYRMVHKDGSIKWVLDRGVVIERDTDGIPMKITGTHTDITEKKNAEGSLEFQRRFYEDILNRIPADVAVFSPDHTYLFVNPHGISDPDVRMWIIGKKDEDFCRYRNKPLSLVEERRDKFKEVVRSKKSIEWEELITAPNGSEKTMLRRYFPVINDNGEVTQVIGYGLDITERKQFETALKANEEKYRSILANMNLGLMELDLDDKITYANKTLAQMTGLPGENMIGTNASVFLTAESRELIALKANERREGKTEAYELTVNINGDKRWWLVSAAPKVRDFNVYTGSIIICLDITERKELESQLIAAREKAEQLAKTKEIFLANMSHEIRTPMNAIIGMSNQLGKTKLSENQKFYLNSIHSAADNLLVIINDILDLSKIEAGKLSIENICFEPKRVVGHAMQVLVHKAEEKGLILTNSYCDAKLASVLIGDPYRLNQVLLNLISNAIKFTEHGSVDVSCEVLENTADRQLVQVTVKDTGIGMDKEFLEKIFEKFSQEYESVSRRYGGTGLGMSICRDLVQLMGGDIEVQSEKRKGTTVRFRITFKKGKTEDLPVILSPTAITSDFLRKKTILVVDDNEMNRLVASNILKNYGADIIEAVNGEQAVTIVGENETDLILMDIQMPFMNGYQATGLIRKTGRTIPIIALTANAIKGESEKCIEAGMNDYIPKPFKEDEFLRKIAYWLQADVKIKKEITGEEDVTLETSYSLYDLSSLKSISRGNEDFINKMLKLFVDQVPSTILEIKKVYELNEFDKIKKLAHRLKPSIDNLGIQTIKKEIREIESKAEIYGRSEKLESLIKKVERVTGNVVNELKSKFV